MSEDLGYFVETGKRPEEDKGTNKEYHVFPCEEEAGMITRWTSSGLKVTYNRQQVDLKDRITIAYMKVEDPKTKLSISMIPWFMVVGRPFPIFTYIYAIGHYQRSEQKSLQESAAAVRKLFGISTFHKSTVSRSLSAMEGFIEASRLEQPLTADALKKPVCPPNGQTGPHKSDIDIVEQISEILASYPSFEALERDIGERIKRLPKPLKGKGNISCALSRIPDEPFEIIIRNESGGRPSRDHRKRPPRPRAKGPKPVQHPLKFVEHLKREEKRKEFIAISRCLTLDAAIKYHRFLI